MISKPLISIIMPVYNAGEYIYAAIQSILDQTFHDFELIIIDDGSMDESQEIINSFQDERIIYLYNGHNIGNYSSRNRGLNLSRGKYIAVMDADDISFTNRLEMEYRYMETHPDILAVGSSCICIPSQRLTVPPLSTSGIRLSLLQNNCFIHSTIMFKRNVILANNGYNTYFQYAADYELMCRLALKGKVRNLKEPLIYYRTHSEQISNVYGQEQRECAYNIRIGYHKAFIKKYRSRKQNLISDIEVSYPLMGTCISLYTYARKTNNKHIEHKADILLDNIISIISSELPLKRDGLLGIGCGLIYLLRNGFVEGDEDEVLTEIDEVVKEKLNSKKNDDSWSFREKDLQEYLYLRMNRNN